TGYYTIQAADVKPGSDTVILTLCAASVVMFLAASANKLLAKKWFALLLVGAVGSVALSVLLSDRLGLASLALLRLVAAGWLYGAVIAIVDRFTPYRLMSRLAERVTFAMVPPLLLIFAVLG